MLNGHRVGPDPLEQWALKRALSIATTGRIEHEPDASPWREGKGRLIIVFGVSDMARATQFTIGWCMIAIALIGYFCAFPELAVLLGIFVASLLFVCPVLVVPYLAHRFLLRNHRPAGPRL
jgi:hypothetical protein